VSTHPESGMTRALYDCPAVPLTPGGLEIRLVVATHTVTSSPPKIGIERDGTVYELFVSTLPSPAFTSSDVLDLYLHRGSFEMVLADEDMEQNSDRWYSHTSCGQEFCQILAQWVWNEAGWNWGRSSPLPNCARPNLPRHRSPSLFSPSSPQARRSNRRRSTMVLPNGHVLRLPEAFLALLLSHNRMGRYAVPPIIRSPHKSAGRSAMAPFGCCMLRALAIVEAVGCRSQCQESSEAVKPRRVSAVFWPLSSPPSASSPPLENAPSPLPLAPVMWKDWPRCRIRREWLKVIRRETIVFAFGAMPAPSPVTPTTEEVLTRAQRAHWRLSWEQRLARNARPSDAPRLSVTLHGLPATFAQSFAFDLLVIA